MFVLRALLLGLALILAALPAAAQGSNAATDRGVHPNASRMPASEDQLLRVLGETRMPDGRIDGRVYLPNPELRHVVQPEGRTWRDFRVTGSRWIHALLILAAVAAVILLFLVAGAQAYERDPEGRRILRFRPVDRFVHWMTAVSFVTLAVTGLLFVFGRILIQPWLGDPAFHALAGWGLVIHNGVAAAFLLGILAMAVMWMRDNVFRRVDWYWFRRGGGILSGEHVPAEKFNAGQKGIYWISLVGGLAMGLTGIALLLPIAVIGVNGMQWAHAGHTVVAALFIAVIIGHVYLGSFGVSGSFDAMSRGTVDLAWAKTHHPLWPAARLADSALEPSRDVTRPPR